MTRVRLSTVILKAHRPIEDRFAKTLFQIDFFGGMGWPAAWGDTANI
jgi:hypothetical protein